LNGKNQTLFVRPSLERITQKLLVELLLVFSGFWEKPCVRASRMNPNLLGSLSNYIRGNPHTSYELHNHGGPANCRKKRNGLVNANLRSEVSTLPFLVTFTIKCIFLARRIIRSLAIRGPTYGTVIVTITYRSIVRQFAIRSKGRIK
jgi:hypothetical protein